MTPPPCFRFAVAPHFHLSTDWRRRLRIGDGGQVIDGFIRPPSWRPPTLDELSRAVRPATEPMSDEEQGELVCLFQLPEHLRSAWWQLLERAVGELGAGPLPGSDAFVGQVVEFLNFKSLAVPAGARCDVVVSGPAAWAEAYRGRLWGGINLGDEETTVVLGPVADHRCVRLTLGPGEGCRLPRGDLLLSGPPPGKQEPDVLLLIAHEQLPSD